MGKQIRQQGPTVQTWAYFATITNYLYFILNQYHEAGQKPAQTTTLKKVLDSTMKYPLFVIYIINYAKISNVFCILQLCIYHKHL